MKLQVGPLDHDVLQECTKKSEETFSRDKEMHNLENILPPLKDNGSIGPYWVSSCVPRVP